MAHRVLQQDHLQRKSLESGCGMRYGYWRVFENGEAEIPIGGLYGDPGKMAYVFILELGPCVEMASEMEFLTFEHTL